eukprot:5195678-Amphidinium_carterae.1
MEKWPLCSVGPGIPLVCGKWPRCRKCWALSSCSRSSQACRDRCCPGRSSQAGVKAPVHFGHLGLPRDWEMALPISLKVGIVQWCREHGAHAMPGHCCQSIPLLQANRAEHP